MGKDLDSPDCYTLIVEARLKSNGKWVELDTFYTLEKTGRKIQRGFWIFKWEEDEYVEDKLRLDKAVMRAQQAMLNPEYQDVRIEDQCGGIEGDSYRYIWINGRWHQHY